MGVLLAAVTLAAITAVSPAQPLPSRALPVELFVLADNAGLNFDLYDVRAEVNEPAKYTELPSHSIFAIRRHVGVAAGYDQGIVHGSVGLYVTIAEWGRWNFGVTSPEIGFGRYRVYDRRTRESVTTTQSTILISLASVHYRGGYLRSIRKNWYVTLEQIFDSRANVTGSQVGFSFSNP